MATLEGEQLRIDVVPATAVAPVESDPNKGALARCGRPETVAAQVSWYARLIYPAWQPDDMKFWQAYGIAFVVGMAWLVAINLVLGDLLGLPPLLVSALAVIPGVVIVTVLARRLSR